MDSGLQLGAGDTVLTEPGFVLLDMVAADRYDAAAQLAELLYRGGRLRSLPEFLEQVQAREHQLATGLPGGIGLPHARSDQVTAASIAVGVTKYGHSLDFGAADGPATVVLLIATPAGSFSEHLEVLATLARSLYRPAFRESLRRAQDAGVIAELINSSVVFFDH